jgi:coenzyme F420-reducing hydrogenase delta subunit
LLEYVGFEPGRFRARWISGSEGAKFAQTVEEITAEIKALGPNTKMRQKLEIPNKIPTGVKDNE